MNKRQQIVDALIALLDTIPAVTGKVSAWRNKDYGVAELPAVLVRDEDADCSFADADLSQQHHGLVIKIAMFLTGKTSAAQARQAVSDILQVIGQNRTLGLDEVWLELDKHDISVETDGNITGVAFVQITARYFTPLWTA